MRSRPRCAIPRGERSAKWRPELEDLRDQLARRGAKQREAAAAAIRGLSDPEAIPAMRAVLSPHSEQCAALVVEALSQMPEQAATECLAWHAVACTWPAVRETAARELGQRPPEAFVPLLLAEMYTPVVSRLDIVPVRGGNVMYRHRFLRKGQEERQLMVLDTAYRRVALPSGDGWESLGRAWADSLATAASRELNLVQQNLLREELNGRIARALNVALDEQLPASPQEWWEWWDEQNSVVRQGDKQTRTLQSSTQRTVVDQPTFGVQTGSPLGQGPLRQTFECFAAGTPVFTLTGFVEIEKIKVGDLVLAQNVESGELAFKPVFRASVRPSEPLCDVQVGNLTFHATRGHPLWVSGNGWVKVGNLKSGMQVHALSGTMPVLSVDGAAAAAETFNLIVADFHTYFVGEDRVLSHDLSSQRPTRSVVPGLAGY